MSDKIVTVTIEGKTYILNRRLLGKYMLESNCDTIKDIYHCTLNFIKSNRLNAIENEQASI